jgi:hypothetical protein
MTVIQANEPKEAMQILAKAVLSNGFTTEALHVYSDTAGAPIYWRIRLKHPQTGDKWIRPMKKNAQGDYQLGEPAFDKGKPLYRLRELTMHPDEQVMFVEGEWCADALQERGILATTSGAADSAGKADFSPLAGRVVKIWPDNDPVGMRYAMEVTARLQTLGCSVQWIDIASLGLPHKGDCVDWLATHRDATLADIAALATIEPPCAPVANASAERGTYADWPEPQSIHADLHPVPPFDADVLLPVPLRLWIMDEADRMPCPPDFIAASALVALGSVIGARCAIKPKSQDDWLVVPNLWGGVVGLPSAKKSPAIGAALKPLDKLIARATEVHQQSMYAFEAEKTVFEAKLDAIEAGIKKAAKNEKWATDLDAKAKELQAHRQGGPQAPVLRRYKSNDTTVEKLGEILRDNPSGLLVMRDELTGLISSWDKDGREGDRAFYLEAWNGNSSFDTDRIGRGSIFISNICVSIFGGLQPDKLVGYLEQASHALANDGMLQRFQILVYPDPTPWKWQDRRPNQEAREQVMRVFEALAEFDPIVLGASPPDSYVKFPHFQFDSEAQAVCIEWSTDLHQRVAAEENPIIAQHLAKFDKLFPALALIFHLVDCATTGRNGAVGMESVLRAAAWCEYLEAHARRCYGLLLDDGLRAAQALSKTVVLVTQAKCDRLSMDGFTARDVRRNQWRHLRTDNDVLAALDWLEDEGWLRSMLVPPGPQGGRPTRIYRINPKVAKLASREGRHG